MKVYILGLDHGTQNRDGKVDASYHAEFDKLVRELVKEHDITFIGDETFADKRPIAKEVAESLNIRWEPIEMTKEARKALGIEHEQNDRHEPIFKDNLACFIRERSLVQGYVTIGLLWS